MKSPSKSWLRMPLGGMAALFCMCTPHTSYAQVPNNNWMRDYVQLRVQSRTAQALSSNLARIARNSSAIIGPRIVGGTVAAANDNPFQVALLNRSIDNNQESQFCGGTLIAPNFVVTAAHCSDFVSSDEVQILTETRRLDGSGTRRNVSRVVIHPAWNSSSFDNDVAVWQLSSRVENATFASLASEDGSDGNNMLVTGWGLLSEGGDKPVNLMRVSVRLVERSNCNDDNSYSGAITDRMICAGRDVGGKDSCQGDSGGPLTRGPNNTILTGIVSWGTGCARPNLFGIYTRVSNPAIRNFIETTIR